MSWINTSPNSVDHSQPISPSLNLRNSWNLVQFYQSPRGGSEGEAWIVSKGGLVMVLTGRGNCVLRRNYGRSQHDVGVGGERNIRACGERGGICQYTKNKWIYAP